MFRRLESTPRHRAYQAHDGHQPTWPKLRPGDLSGHREPTVRSFPLQMSSIVSEFGVPKPCVKAICVQPSVRHTCATCLNVVFVHRLTINGTVPFKASFAFAIPIAKTADLYVTQDRATTRWFVFSYNRPEKVRYTRNSVQIDYIFRLNHVCGSRTLSLENADLIVQAVYDDGPIRRPVRTISPIAAITDRL